MIEVVFSDSATGSLKMAQHYGGEKAHAMSVGVIISHHDGREPSEEEVK